MERKKKIGIAAATAAGITALSIGGVAAGASAGTGGESDTPLTGTTLEKASAAAIDAAGGGEVTETETSDDAGSTYEVEVQMPSGVEADVHLDKDFNVVAQEPEKADGDDTPLSGATLEKASAAAIDAAGGGEVTETEASDDAGSAYEVEVLLPNGVEADVQLDENFNVVTPAAEQAESTATNG